MTKLVLPLLSLIILSITYTALGNIFVEYSCKATRFPTECLQSLSAEGANIGQSPTKLAETALSISLKKSQALKAFLVKENKKPGLGPKEHAAIKDCLDGIDETLDQLTQSVKEITAMAQARPEQFGMHKSNVQTWVSSVVTNQNTCVEGFDEISADPKFSATVKAKVVEVERVTSNALAFINKLQVPV